VPRTPLRRYEDPLDAVWTTALRQVGLELERSAGAYATTDGRGRLALATQPELDADDCVAQMVLHELCHSLVQGRDSFELPDWGLCNETERDVVLEHACLRLQAALLIPYGLRQALAPTTDYRSFYDALPADPFAASAPGDLEEIALARAAHARRTQRPWGPHLERALRATRDLAGVLTPHLPEDHLLAAAEQPPAPHATGLLPAFAPTEERTCATCSWAKPRGSDGQGLTCVASGRKVAPSQMACAHHETDVDCLSCGACCREAYDTVEVGPRDRARSHAELLVARQGGYDMARRDQRCAALGGGERLPARGRPARTLPLYVPSADPFVCSIYDDRPTTCRNFTRRSAHCLSARRAVGLSL